MEDIKIPMELLKKHNLTINEYLILYSLANDQILTTLFEFSMKQLVKLETKGFIKITRERIFLREKTQDMFSVNEDLFLIWLNIYPIRVKKTRSFGSRALSPEKADTILGRKLRAKWDLIFRKKIKAQQKAIQVLELQLKDMEKSGDLEYMVEATRWLNEGYHEKYSYLLDESRSEYNYESEDYI